MDGCNRQGRNQEQGSDQDSSGENEQEEEEEETCDSLGGTCLALFGRRRCMNEFDGDFHEDGSLCPGFRRCCVPASSVEEEDEIPSEDVADGRNDDESDTNDNPAEEGGNEEGDESSLTQDEDSNIDEENDNINDEDEEDEDNGDREEQEEGEEEEGQEGDDEEVQEEEEEQEEAEAEAEETCDSLGGTCLALLGRRRCMNEFGGDFHEDGSLCPGFRRCCVPSEQEEEEEEETCDSLGGTCLALLGRRRCMDEFGGDFHEDDSLCPGFRRCCVPTSAEAEEESEDEGEDGDEEVANGNTDDSETEQGENDEESSTLQEEAEEEEENEGESEDDDEEEDEEAEEEEETCDSLGGTCLALLARRRCINEFGGDFQGPGSLCPGFRRCCVPGEGNEIPEEKEEETCDSLGGTCLALLSRRRCQNEFGGDFHEDGSLCPGFRRCCVPTTAAETEGEAEDDSDDEEPPSEDENEDAASDDGVEAEDEAGA